MSIFPPTDEQLEAMELVRGPGDVAVEALAGTGKTSTLRFIADDQPRTRIAYLAFNRAIVNEARETMPDNVKASTAHSLAFRAVGRHYAHRLRSERMTSAQIARAIGVRGDFTWQLDEGQRVVRESTQAGLVMRAVRRFCQTADEHPGAWHVPLLEGLDEPGEYVANAALAEHLAPHLTTAWEDLTRRQGRLPFAHDVYLKLWQLEGPRIGADLILFDEAQDANPLMAAIVAAQAHAQRVYVGDTYQQIYGWNGAINTMREVAVDERTWLTHSFRFGPEIAAEANTVLARLGAEARLTGRGSPGSVGPIEAGREDVGLFRTNAATVSRALEHLSSGGRPHIVGGADEVVRFARGAQALMDTGRTEHPELACFVSWDQVLAYVAEDQLGGDLRLLVSLIEDFGSQAIIDGLGRMSDERDADVVLSTAHKAKGRQWPAVRLGPDFPEEPSEEELRLLYVAMTRARQSLDIEALPELPAARPTITQQTPQDAS